MAQGVMICGEVVGGALAPVTMELLGGGRRLADALGHGLSAVLLGSGLGDLAKEAIAFGADKVYVVDDPLLQTYQTDAYLAVIEKVCKDAEPEVLLMGQTNMGRDLAPRVAFRLGTGACLDCVALDVDPNTKNLLQTKPVYGGNALAVYVCESARPQVATVRVKALDPLERDASRQGEVVAVASGIDESVIKAKVLETVKQEVAGIKLEDADVVITGGRGLGGPEPFKDLEELAKLLGGAVGASRPPCDNGWVPASMQIGLTGKIVSPTLYVAIAISGSSQHLAGCTGSKNIVAINRDPEANIFKVAKYGVVGDFKQVLPALIGKVKELVAG